MRHVPGRRAGSDTVVLRVQQMRFQQVSDNITSKSKCGTGAGPARQMLLLRAPLEELGPPGVGKTR